MFPELIRSLVLLSPTTTPPSEPEALPIISLHDSSSAYLRASSLFRIMATPSTPPSTSTASSSYVFPSTDSSSPAEEISSLPSSDTADDDESTIGDDEDDHGLSDAEREWRESLQQLELLLTMVVVPFVGKYFGRKAAYWGKLLPCY
jgi:hypothetical protein